MSEQRINEYIEGKYGKFGVDRYGTNLLESSLSLSQMAEESLKISVQY